MLSVSLIISPPTQNAFPSDLVKSKVLAKPTEPAQILSPARFSGGTFSFPATLAFLLFLMQTKLVFLLQVLCIFLEHTSPRKPS